MPTSAWFPGTCRWSRRCTRIGWRSPPTRPDHAPDGIGILRTGFQQEGDRLAGVLRGRGAFLGLGRRVGGVGIDLDGPDQEGRLGARGGPGVRAAAVNTLVQVTRAFDHRIRPGFLEILGWRDERRLPRRRFPSHLRHVGKDDAIHLENFDIGGPRSGHLVHLKQGALSGDRQGPGWLPSSPRNWAPPDEARSVMSTGTAINSILFISGGVLSTGRPDHRRRAPRPFWNAMRNERIITPPG